MSEEFLTKEQAVAEHRKMWNWIADYLESCKPEELPSNIIHIKDEYFISNNIDDVPVSSCYCCDYDMCHTVLAYQRRCTACPINWIDSTCTGICGLYGEILKLNPHEDFKLMSKLAREIANLPEKEE